MTLNEWMTSTRTRAPEIAAVVGCDPSWVRHLRAGKATPSMAVAQMIAVFTDGAVGMDDWPAPQSTRQPRAPRSPAIPAPAPPGGSTAA